METIYWDDIERFVDQCRENGLDVACGAQTVVIHCGKSQLKIFIGKYNPLQRLQRVDWMFLTERKEGDRRIMNDFYDLVEQAPFGPPFELRCDKSGVYTIYLDDDGYPGLDDWAPGDENVSRFLGSIGSWFMVINQ